MDTVGNNIRNSLLKRQEALNKFEARKISFFVEKKKIMEDIETAASNWKLTLEQLPPKEFAQ
jgi:hypothetical protein